MRRKCLPRPCSPVHDAQRPCLPADGSQERIAAGFYVASVSPSRTERPCPELSLTASSNAAQVILLSTMLLVIMYLPREIPARAPPRGVDEETSCCGRREEKG